MRTLHALPLAIGAALASPPALAADGLAGNWRVTHLAGKAVPKGQEATLSFDGQRITGKAFCNRYFASYTLTGSVITVSQAGSTRMACPGLPMRLESQFLTILARADRASVSGGVLSLSAPGKRTIAAQRAR